MGILITRQRLSLGRNGSVATARFQLAANTDSIRIRIARETLARPGPIFGLGSRITPVIRVRAGTQDFLCAGRSTGGRRLSIIDEIYEYGLAYRLPWGFFGDPANAARRLGEEKTSLDVLIEIALRGDPIDTFWSVESTEADAPQVVHHSSVAWDASTDGQEESGDGVLSVSHTAGGTNRAAFAAGGHSGGGVEQDTTSITYGGNAMTERWDVANTYIRLAASTLAGDGSIATSSQAVTHTLAGGANQHGLTVSTFTGVSSGASVGTPQTQAGGGAAPSVTATSLTTDGMIVDAIAAAHNDVPTLTAGANQTGRTDEGISFMGLASSTQSSNDGGVMSWTNTGIYGEVLGAIEFKPSIVASAAPTLMLMGVGP